MLLLNISEIVFFCTLFRNKQRINWCRWIENINSWTKDCGGKVNEISRKRCSNNDEDEIPDDDIFFDELDGEDASYLPLKKRRPSRASKSDKVLLAFNKMREERKERYVEENHKKEQRHNEKMEKTQQLIDVLKSMGSMDSSKRTSSRSRSSSHSRSKKRLTSPKFHSK